MKARVKATGEIVEVENCVPISRHGALFYGYKDANGIEYLPNEIELKMDFDYWEACQDETPDTPDYWTRLEHQYAGMAMQALLLTNNIRNGDLEGMRECNTNAMAIAYALVEKLKEKEEGE